MNLSLQDPFAVAKEYPDALVNTLHYGHSVAIRFNHKGDYLASGLSDGTILIHDMSTNGGIVAHLHKDGHTRPITSLSWSSCGRYLLSSSQDWTCRLWDLANANLEETLEVIRHVRFDGPIWMASIHPTTHLKFTASLFDDDPVFVDVTNEEPAVTRLATEAMHLEEENIETDEGPPHRKRNKDRNSTLVCIFTPYDGLYIFTGTRKGYINVFLTSTLELVHSFKVCNANIKNLVISPNGRKLAVNASDRIIRQINLPDLINIDSPEQWEFELEHKYQDVVNRLQWNSVSFNHNGEFLVASTFGQSQHDLYVWETSLGSLIKILEGSSEELVDVKWNYPRCMISSLGIDSGTVYMWLVQFPPKWSALAPDFVEIEENIEYEEKEDEFDIIDDFDLKKKRLKGEDGVLDIVTRESVDARGFNLFPNSFIIPINYELSYSG